MKAVFTIVTGLALAGGALAAWHYWDMNPIAAGLLAFAGVLVVGKGVGFAETGPK